MNSVPQQPGHELNAYAKTIAAAWNKQLSGIAASKGSQLNAAAFNAAVCTAMDLHLNQLAQTKVWGPDNREASGLLWDAVGELLTAGSLQLHAREKPQGYAGDFRLLQRICQSDVQGSGMGAAFDHFFQNHAAPNAVRNRANILTNSMLEFARGRAETHIVSYGSGPAYELRMLCEKLDTSSRQNLHITLLDLDPKALGFAAEQLAEFVGPDKLNTVRANLNRLPRLKNAADSFPPADFIYASGFFDYLDHGQAVELIRFFWQRLLPQGKMFIFNFGEDNPSRAYMEWVANWYLTYRTDEQMQSLARDSNLPSSNWQTGVEPAGVNRFLTAAKPA